MGKIQTKKTFFGKIKSFFPNIKTKIAKSYESIVDLISLGDSYPTTVHTILNSDTILNSGDEIKLTNSSFSPFSNVEIPKSEEKNFDFGDQLRLNYESIALDSNKKSSKNNLIKLFENVQTQIKNTFTFLLKKALNLRYNSLLRKTIFSFLLLFIFPKLTFGKVKLKLGSPTEVLQSPNSNKFLVGNENGPTGGGIFIHFLQFASNFLSIFTLSQNIDIKKKLDVQEQILKKILLFQKSNLKINIFTLGLISSILVKESLKKLITLRGGESRHKDREEKDRLTLFLEKRARKFGLKQDLIPAIVTVIEVFVVLTVISLLFYFFYFYPLINWLKKSTDHLPLDNSSLDEAFKDPKNLKKPKEIIRDIIRKGLEKSKDETVAPLEPKDLKDFFENL